MGNKKPAANTCPVCSKVLAGGLARHMRVHTGERPFKCETCGRAFARRITLQRHERTHTKVRPYVCDMCPVRYATACALQDHRNEHTGDRPYVCGVCAAAFSKKKSLAQHATRKHGTDGERGRCECPVCSKICASRGHFKRHALRAHGIASPTPTDGCAGVVADRTRCPVCCKPVASEEYLAVHVRLHTGERPYECAECGRAFASRPGLRKHMRVHHAGPSSAPPARDDGPASDAGGGGPVDDTADVDECLERIWVDFVTSANECEESAGDLEELDYFLSQL